MRRGRLPRILAAGVLTLACDARIPFSDGRHGPPDRAAWQRRLTVPGRLESAAERRDNGGVLHLLVTGSPGQYEISASVSGSSCEGVGGDAPVVDVRTEETSIARWSVAAGMPAPYVASFVLEEAPRHLDFLFTNALFTHDCYRSVTIHSVDVVRGR